VKLQAKGYNPTITKSQFQPIIDCIADQPPGWRADLITKAGRIVKLQYVMTTQLVYLAMAIDLPLWVIKAIDKIISFHW
jgi:hypothetical protein